MGNNTRMCRICLVAKFEDLVAFEAGNAWSHLFEFCTGISVTTGNAPQYFCKVCSDKLREFANFKKKCLKSDILWNSLIKNKNEPKHEESKLEVANITNDDNDSYFDDRNESDDHFTDTNTIESKDDKTSQTTDMTKNAQLDDSMICENQITVLKTESEEAIASVRKSTRIKKPPVKFSISTETAQAEPILCNLTIGSNSIKDITGKSVNIISYLDASKEEKEKNKHNVQKSQDTTCEGTPVKIISLLSKQETKKLVVKTTVSSITKIPIPNMSTNNPKINKNIQKKSKINEKVKIFYSHANLIVPKSQASNFDSNVALKHVKIVSYMDKPDTNKDMALKESFQELEELEDPASDDDGYDYEKTNNDSDYDPDEEAEYERCNKPKSTHNGVKIKVVKLSKPIKLPMDTLFDCGICNNKPCDPESWTRHWNMHIDKNHLFCLLCQFMGRDMADMAAHRYEHLSADIQIRCPQCFSTHKYTKILEFHYRSVHLNKKGGLCKYCGHESATVRRWKQHEQTHTDLIICDHCGCRFASNDTLKEHLMSISAPKNFICQHCGKGFIKKSNLKGHIELVHINNKLKCNHCNETFRNKYVLKMHLDSVSGPKYFCETCGKGFLYASYLERHVIIHTNVRPFTCDLCKKTFRFRTNLKDHMLIHMGVKSFSCSICSKTFYKKNHVKRHMSCHTGTRPVKCLYKECDRTFYGNKAMKAHCESKHRLCDLKDTTSSNTTGSG